MVLCRELLPVPQAPLIPNHVTPTLSTHPIPNCSLLSLNVPAVTSATQTTALPVFTGVTVSNTSSHIENMQQQMYEAEQLGDVYGCASVHNKHGAPSSFPSAPKS